MRRVAAAARALLFAGLAVAGSVPVQLRAQAVCGLTDGDARAAGWPAPLGRAITLHERDLSLGEALERVAAAAQVRFSYSSDLLPLERRVCIDADEQPLGQVLSGLLRGNAIRAVATSGDHIVLAPDRSREAAREPAPTPPPVISLDPLLVDGQAAPAQRPVAIHVDVVEGRQLERHSAVTLAQALNGTVPGVWLWQTSASSFVAQYGSMRGASTFGFSAPKVFIDGIEVANPLLLTRISPESIERIEVIRGPEGAALYGADAISGVTHIFTRHTGGLEDGGERGRVSTRLGLSATDYAPGPALAQDHTASVRIGSILRSALLNLSLGSEGATVPGAFARRAVADGSLRVASDRTLVTGLLRLSAERASTGASPLLPDSIAFGPDRPTFNAQPLAAEPRSLVQYTIGARVIVTPNAQWTHSVVFGIDGYQLDGVDPAWTPFLTPADSALLAAGASALRGTLRLSTTTNVRTGSFASAALTFTAEHSLLEQQRFLPSQSDGQVSITRVEAGSAASNSGDATVGTDWPLQRGPAEPHTVARSRSNSGLSAQLNTTILQNLLVSSGVRLEQSGGSAIGTGVAALPMLAGALTGQAGPLDFKLRTAWGRSIRWPELPGYRTVWTTSRTPLSVFDLGPERQAGIEAGVDVALGRTLSVQLTRFDQTASGLVQRTGGENEPALPGGIGVGTPAGGSLLYGIENVGEITNRGWEVQASFRRGALSLGGTLSLVDSRVRQLAAGYGGDLRPGDRILAVPAHIVGLTAGWTAADWSATIGAARAADWINYDRLALADALLQDRHLDGEELREFWRTYEGVTHLRAAFSRVLRPGISLSFAAENLLDQQVGEPDNITVLPGRTFSLGLRASF